MSKVDFDVDWDALFPGEPFTVGTLSHNVTPLDLEGISKITRKIKLVVPLLQKEGIDFENFHHNDNVIKLIPILMDHAPDIVSEATGISLESLVKFKPQYLLELVTIAIKVNLDSKESLEKNFESLVGTFQSLPEKTQEGENLD